MIRRPRLLLLCVLSLLIGTVQWAQGYAAAPADAQAAHCAQHEGASPVAPAGGDCCQHDAGGCGCAHAALLMPVPALRMPASKAAKAATHPAGLEPVPRLSSPFRPPI